MFEEITPNVFSLECDLRLAPGFHLATRMYIVRRGDALWVHSPLPAATQWYDAAREIGEVRVLVAPNAFHHLYMKDAAAAFPEAVVCGSQALAKKRPDLDFGHVFETGAHLPEGWPTGVRVIPVGGAPKSGEVLFCDEASGSLLVTDLLFNNQRPNKWLTRAFVRVTSGWNSPKRSKLWNWFLIKDKSAFSESLEILDDLAWDRVLPAHGNPVDDRDLAISLIRGAP